MSVCKPCGVTNDVCCVDTSGKPTAQACNDAGAFCSNNMCVASTGHYHMPCQGLDDKTTCDIKDYPGLRCVAGTTDVPFWCDCGSDSGFNLCDDKKVCGSPSGGGGFSCATSTTPPPNWPAAAAMTGWGTDPYVIDVCQAFVNNGPTSKCSITQPPYCNPGEFQLDTIDGKTPIDKAGQKCIAANSSTQTALTNLFQAGQTLDGKQSTARFCIV